jgi:branched-subunit amino acid transport protein
VTAYLVIAAIAVGSFAMRAAMLATDHERPQPQRAQDALGFVAPAAVAALTATMVFTRSGNLHAAPWPEVATLIVAFIVVRRSGQILHGMAVGLPVLWLLTAMGW